MLGSVLISRRPRCIQRCHSGIPNKTNSPSSRGGYAPLRTGPRVQEHQTETEPAVCVYPRQLQSLNAKRSYRASRRDVELDLTERSSEEFSQSGWNRNTHRAIWPGVGRVPQGTQCANSPVRLLHFDLCFVRLPENERLTTVSPPSRRSGRLPRSSASLVTATIFFSERVCSRA